MRRIRRIGTAALLTLIAFNIYALWPKSPPNVVVLLVDTLRVDRLGIYGSHRGITPSIDALAGMGTVFRRAYAQSSWTNPSIASLFTSRFQSQHQVISFGSTLDEREETLAEIFKARGYDTGAFVANILLQPRLGFAQGFDKWQIVARRDDSAPAGTMAFLKGRGGDVNDAAFEWLDGRSKRAGPLFLYIHYMEPHPPYDPPRAVLAARLAGADPPDRETINRYMALPGMTLPDTLLEGAQALYDAEVASADTAIGQLLEGLRARGVLDNAVIVFVGDHGEEFKEHGLVGHNQTLYEEVIRVPFIIVNTTRSAHREIEEPVSLIDVAPTLMELIAGTPRPQFEGRSRAHDVGARPWWAGLLPSPQTSVSHPVFSELIKADQTLRLSPHEHAVLMDGTKLITGVSGERDYYDLHTDPGETDPNGVVPGQRAALDDAVKELKAYAAGGPTPVAPALDAQTRERMRVLGYAE